MQPKILSSVGVRDLESALTRFFKAQSNQAGATPLEAATVALRTLWLHVDQGGPASQTGNVLQDLYNRLRARVGVMLPPEDTPINPGLLRYPGLAPLSP